LESHVAAKDYFTNAMMTIKKCLWVPYILRLWLRSTDNRSTNIRKNPHEQYFSDGVFCFVNHP
jgi:hypothetical protein